MITIAKRILLTLILFLVMATAHSQTTEGPAEKAAREMHEMNMKFHIQDSLLAVELLKDRQREILDSLNNIKIRKRQAQQYKENEEKQEALREENYKKQKEQKEAHRQWIINNYGDVIGNEIINHKVEIGWTKQMCIESWGRPYEINKTTTEYEVNEQWVYSIKHYLYFEGNKLTAIQE